VLKISKKSFWRRRRRRRSRSRRRRSLAYRVNYCDKQPTLRVSLGFI
jgi:hypothetical protein